MKEIIILIGNIGSGKTTFCKQLVKKGYIIISQDDLRYSIGAGNYTFNISYEPCIRELSLSMVRSFMKKGILLAIDETNMSRKIRARYLNLAKIYKYKTKGIIFKKLSKKVSVKRRLKNNHGKNSQEIWDMVWDMFNDIYEKPRKNEGFNKIIQL